jgi:hypothetical protein
MFKSDGFFDLDPSDKTQVSLNLDSLFLALYDLLPSRDVE